MERQGIPTARYGSFSDPQEACTFIRTSVRTETAHLWSDVIVVNWVEKFQEERLFRFGAIKQKRRHNGKK